jgi:hypothetical protein
LLAYRSSFGCLMGLHYRDKKVCRWGNLLRFRSPTSSADIERDIPGSRITLRNKLSQEDQFHGLLLIVMKL